MYFHKSLIPRGAYFFFLPLESKQEATSGWNFTKCISEVKVNQLKVKNMHVRMGISIFKGSGSTSGSSDDILSRTTAPPPTLVLQINWHSPCLLHIYKLRTFYTSPKFPFHHPLPTLPLRYPYTLFKRLVSLAEQHLTPSPALKEQNEILKVNSLSCVLICWRHVTEKPSIVLSWP